MYGMTSKGCFIRIGTAAEPMPLQMIDRLYSKRVRNSLRTIRSPKRELTFEQLKIYYESTGKTLTPQFASNLEMLTDDGDYNYVAYLLADVNVTSVKVAKYNGLDRYYLSKNNEYGNCSLIKATKMVLDKFELENKTFAHITHRERLERPLWNRVALREALLNAILHNDYTDEGFPKFEIFDDRLEITSFGGLPGGLTEEDFFEGVSRPRNKELMRIFRDIELVEYLGSGMPRILKSYGRENFIIKENYIRMVLPKDKDFTMNVTEQDNAQDAEFVDTQVIMPDTPHVTPHVTPNVKKLLCILDLEHAITRADVLKLMELNDRKWLMTIPDKPKSILQKYRLTQLGMEMKMKLQSEGERIEKDAILFGIVPLQPSTK
jgi:predicted HTH transcriptional regulator